MPRVRVFLLTFRRPQFLPRALESLRMQTFRDWVAEVHNGDPTDPFPGELLARTGDPRLRLIMPPQGTGPVEAFNLAHAPAPELYQSILEDDNWWEPEFLETMIATLEAHPETELAWSNMRVWTEEAGGSCRDTGTDVWPLGAGMPCRLFWWPQLIHFGDFLYSNGSMLLRSRSAAQLILPEDTPPDMIEHTRERCMPFPILLVPDRLANYVITRRTFRSSDYVGWGETQALLGAAFLAAVPMTAAARRKLWAFRRSQSPRATNPLIFSGLMERNFAFLAHATAGDWLAFARGCLRRPLVAWRTLRAKRRFRRFWSYLLSQTAAQTAQARRRGFVALDETALVDKSEVADHGLEYLSASARP